mmetsp:Transcript_41872/g.98108  ORF Transcript_41872/g.98108 Transcript_41872/m.98108 type:complete len:306 (-) Transcript_41872:545-1462(-)
MSRHVCVMTDIPAQARHSSGQRQQKKLYDTAVVIRPRPEPRCLCCKECKISSELNRARWHYDLRRQVQKPGGTPNWWVAVRCLLAICALVSRRVVGRLARPCACAGAVRIDAVKQREGGIALAGQRTVPARPEVGCACGVEVRGSAAGQARDDLEQARATFACSMLCSASLVHLAEYQRLKASPRRSGAQRDVILEKRYRCGAPRGRSNRPGKLVRRQSIRRDVEAFDQLDTAAHDERPSQRQEDAAPARCNVPAAVLAALPRELRAHAASRNVWAHVKRRGDAHHLEKPPVDASGCAPRRRRGR